MSLRRLAEKGFTHMVLPAVMVVGIGVMGAFLLAQSHAATCTSYNYSIGGSGSCVKNIQILANHKLPYIPKYPSPTIQTDGQFGPQTKAGIIRIQKAWGLTQDGIVGPHTWQALCSTGTTRPGAGGPFTASEAAAAKAAGCSKAVS